MSTSEPKGDPGPLRATWKSDILSGFLVFLIALPLCLGISMASGFPPIAGILTAVVGGVLVTFLSGSELTIKGPAAGLIVIALGAVEELGQGDPMRGYKLALAVIVAAAAVQIVFGLLRAGVLGDFFPSSAVHGMLAAIGIIIASKQVHTVLGVKPEGKEPLHLIAEIPHSIMNMNPEIAIIGIASLLILFGLPLIKNKYVKMVPAPMVVVLLAIPLGHVFDLEHEHKYLFLDGHDYDVGPRFLVTLPASLTSAVTLPDFSAILTGTSIKYITMFALIGSIESLLSTKAIDMLDPYKRKANLNRDLVAVGVGNMIAGLLGGLPMISEIVRSSANIQNGGKTRYANFFHGAFLLGFVAFAPGLIHQIPLAALGAMLIYTGVRLASPTAFVKTYSIGKEQLLIFLTTILVTLSTDLLVGIGAGIAMKFVIHLVNGVPLKSFFKPGLEVTEEDERHVVRVKQAAIFSNYIPLKSIIEKLLQTKPVELNLSEARVVDHTVMERIHELQHELEGSPRKLVVVGLEGHQPVSAHPRAARHKRILA
jgi:MFS superfamily sulfate permease-like transporter